MTSEAEFDPIRLLQELNEAGVRYIVIGGVAARAFGSPVITVDLDICYARDEANYEALTGMLRRVHSRLRGADAGLPFRLDAKTLARGDTFTFVTDYGALDILGTPSGTTGFDDLSKRAVPVDLDGLKVRVAAIDDIVRMKRAAGRPKDLLAIEELGALREELDDGG